MLLFIGNLVNKIFGKTAKSVASAAEAKVKRETVGKAEAKIQGAQQKMQQKALRSMDNIGPEAAMNKMKGGGAEQPPGAPPPMAPPPGYGPPPQGVPMGYPPPGGYPPPPGHEQTAAGGAAATVAIDAGMLTHTAHVNKPVVGWIVCMKGDQKGQDFRLHDGRNIIGTAADVDIVVHDPYLSARHCAIMIESKEARYIVQDLDSRNGVYLNRQRVSKDDLVDNDEIRIGGTEFRFKSLY